MSLIYNLSQKYRKIWQSIEKKEKNPPLPPKPLFSSTPLKTREINKIYDEEKENYLQSAITINKTDLDAADKNAEESKKEVINDIINPTHVLIVEDTLNLNKQCEYNSNDLEITLIYQIRYKKDSIICYH